jgi:four helix bundle protein
MEVGFKFEKLIVWQKAMEMGEEIFYFSGKFPKSKMFNLTSQIRRAGDSIALNIAEGSILQSNQEFKKFLGYSIRSLSEVVTCIHKARLRQYISQSDFEKYYLNAFNLMNMLIALQKKYM